MTEKTHKGMIRDWVQRPCESGLGYYIHGVADGHPEFHDKIISTSYVVAREAYEIETRNSRYTLEPL